ncbi:copper resistance system multicopper oxidase, partial [Sphingomonadaceae bacterium LXI357]|nr:copper resistance system multicopper oxidase [Stakelama marina]
MELNRRRMLGTMAMAGSAMALPGWARGADLRAEAVRAGFDEVSGASIDLTVGRGPRMVQGRAGHAIAVNGSVPGPLVRLKEGTTAR